MATPEEAVFLLTFTLVTKIFLLSKTNLSWAVQVYIWCFKADKKLPTNATFGALVFVHTFELYGTMVSHVMPCLSG